MQQQETAVQSAQRLRLTDLNSHLVCVLCSGYLVDATTIVECLHSFCRSCLVRHLELKAACPTCEAPLSKAKPFLHIRSDKALQDIVYKLVPGLYLSEMQRRRNFFAQHPDQVSLASAEERGVAMERLVFSPEDHFSLSLEYFSLQSEKECGGVRGDEWECSSSRSSESGLEVEGGPAKRYLRCPALFTVGLLKKFIRMKLELANKHRVDVLHRRVCLPDDYTLMDVAYIYSWRQGSPMRFFYRIYEDEVPCAKKRPHVPDPVSIVPPKVAREATPVLPTKVEVPPKPSVREDKVKPHDVVPLEEKVNVPSVLPLTPSEEVVPPSTPPAEPPVKPSEPIVTPSEPNVAPSVVKEAPSEVKVVPSEKTSSPPPPQTTPVPPAVSVAPSTSPPVTLQPSSTPTTTSDTPVHVNVSPPTQFSAPGPLSPSKAPRSRTPGSGRGPAAPSILSIAQTLARKQQEKQQQQEQLAKPTEMKRIGEVTITLQKPLPDLKEVKDKFKPIQPKPVEIRPSPPAISSLQITQCVKQESQQHQKPSSAVSIEKVNSQHAGDLKKWHDIVRDNNNKKPKLAEDILRQTLSKSHNKSPKQSSAARTRPSPPFINSISPFAPMHRPNPHPIRIPTPAKQRPSSLSSSSSPSPSPPAEQMSPGGSRGHGDMYQAAAAAMLVRQQFELQSRLMQPLHPHAFISPADWGLGGSPAESMKRLEGFMRSLGQRGFPFRPSMPNTAAAAAAAAASVAHAQGSAK